MKSEKLKKHHHNQQHHHHHHQQKPSHQQQTSEEEKEDDDSGNILFSLNSNIIRYEEFDEDAKEKGEGLEDWDLGDGEGGDGGPLRTAHDWQPYKARVFDDGTMTFFWFDFRGLLAGFRMII